MAYLVAWSGRGHWPEAGSGAWAICYWVVLAVVVEVVYRCVERPFIAWGRSLTAEPQAALALVS